MSSDHLDTNQVEDLYEAILGLKTKSECRKFLRDLCTLTELKSMSERFQVAKRVDAGLPYRQIAIEVPSSTATVTRVANWLRNGEGGYRLALNRIKKK